jgi:glycine C-acetyltransferase
MKDQVEYRGGENFSLRQMLLKGKDMSLQEKVEFFSRFIDELAGHGQMLCMRPISSPTDREVVILDPETELPRSMLMFGSNNYLGLATHPSVLRQTCEAVLQYGIGLGGPPLLNGYTTLHRELEERLARLKGTEDAMIFSSGYAANVGLASGLFSENAIVLSDAYSHASFSDGVRLSGAQAFHFPHNDCAQLERLLRHHTSPSHDTYVAVEGVYSMDGDTAPLPRIVALCEKYNAVLLLDDAHGTGVMGQHGRGTAEHYDVEGRIPITMGTFSKTFAVTGAFVAASRKIITYLRFFARSYMFSASLPPPVVASVLAGLDVMEKEPERLASLRGNVHYATSGLRGLGFDLQPEAAILPLRVPESMRIREASRKFHERGIFVNSVEYPAVPIREQRFRISMMATHTREDIDRLLSAVKAIWSGHLPLENAHAECRAREAA